MATLSDHASPTAGRCCPRGHQLNKAQAKDARGKGRCDGCGAMVSLEDHIEFCVRLSEQHESLDCNFYLCEACVCSAEGAEGSGGHAEGAGAHQSTSQEILCTTNQHDQLQVPNGGEGLARASPVFRVGKHVLSGQVQTFEKKTEWCSSCKKHTQISVLNGVSASFGCRTF